MKGLIQGSIIFLLGIIFSTSLYGQKKQWNGTLDSGGKLKIEFAIPESKPFVLQGYFYFRKNWRPLKIFFNKTEIWSDMGSAFKNKKYKINYID